MVRIGFTQPSSTMVNFSRATLLSLIILSSLSPVRTSDEDDSNENFVKNDLMPSQQKLNNLVRNPMRSPSQNDPSSSTGHRISANAFPRGSADKRSPPQKIGNNEPCVGCASNQRNKMLEATLPEQTLRQLRLEMIKSQILKKLRLDSPPMVGQIPRDQMILPPPVIFGDTMNSQDSHDDDNDGSRDFEDFYGKTEQVIVFSESVLPNCDSFVKHSNSESSTCFIFKSPKDIEVEKVSKVELWFHKSPNTNDFVTNQTFWVYELFAHGGNNIPRHPKELGTQAYVRQRQGWLSLDITNSTSKWLRSKLMKGLGLTTANLEHTVQIGCRNCGTMKDESPVGTLRENRPFIVFSIVEAEKKRRKRREINCSNRTTECCRERFPINFKEIGWHWVTYPESYDAFICKGSCIGENSLFLSANKRTTAGLDYIGSGPNRTHLTPCCSATKMSSIDISYIESPPPGSTNQTITILKKKLPNMVIESCGCQM